MPCEGTFHQAAAARGICQNLGKRNAHRAYPRSSRVNLVSCRHATTSTTPAPASDDHTTNQGSPSIRKYKNFAWPPVHREDIFVNSLTATVKAHRWRRRQSDPKPIPSASSTPSVVRKVAVGVYDPPQLGGDPHLASFEDFRIQFKPGDEEWERRLGACSEIGSDGVFLPNEAKLAATTVATTSAKRDVLEDVPDSTSLPISYVLPRQHNLRLSHRSLRKPRQIESPYSHHRGLPKHVTEAQNHYIKHGSSEELLSALIMAFERFLNFRAVEHDAIRQVIGYAFTVIESVLPGKEMVRLHGSYATRLASPLSDIDMNISLPEDGNDLINRGPSPERQQIRRKRLQVLRKVRDAFRARSASISLSMIEAQYPLLIVQDPESKVVYQIGCGRKVGRTTETIRALLDEYPTLRPLYVLLRYILLIRGLNDASTGGVGSYTLLIMIATALKQSKSILRGDNLAQQLLAVLDFWRSANIRKTGYATMPPWTFPKYETPASLNSAIPDTHDSLASTERASDTTIAVDNVEETNDVAAGIKHLQAQNLRAKRKYQTVWSFHHHPEQLCLQDPADPSNDLGFPAYQLPAAIATLNSALKALRAAMDTWEAAPLERRDDPALNLLWPLVASDFAPVHQRRLALRSVAGAAKSGPSESHKNKVEKV